MSKGKIVLVPFPFDDLSASKVRPAVCLTDPVGVHRHIVLAFITSRVPDDPLESDLVIDAASPDFSETGLRVTSTVRLHRVLTTAAAVIQRELGILPERARKEAARRLRKLFEL